MALPRSLNLNVPSLKGYSRPYTKCKDIRQEVALDLYLARTIEITSSITVQITWACLGEGTASFKPHTAQRDEAE